MRITRRQLRSILVYGLIAAGIYFGNVEVQSYLGRKARVASGLESLPLDEALARARSESKLVLADMSAVWCSSCRRLDQRVFSDPEVRRRIENDFVFARIEYESDEGKAFQKRYQVKGFPTLLVLDAEGDLVRRLPVTLDPARFRQLLPPPENHG